MKEYYQVLPGAILCSLGILLFLIEMGIRQINNTFPLWASKLVPIGVILLGVFGLIIGMSTKIIILEKRKVKQ